MKRAKPKGLLGRKHGLAGTKPKKELSIPLSPTTINSLILGGGVVLGLVAWPYRGDPLGAILLGVGADIAAISLFFLVKDLLSPAPATS